MFRNFFFEKFSKIPCSHFLPFFRPFLTRKFFWAKSIFFEREHLLLFLFCQEKDFVCSLLPLFCFDLTTHVAFFLDATLYLFKGPEVYLNLFCEFFFWENSLFCILNIWGFVSFFFLSFFSVFFFENSNRMIPTIFFRLETVMINKVLWTVAFEDSDVSNLLLVHFDLLWAFLAFFGWRDATLIWELRYFDFKVDGERTMATKKRRRDVLYNALERFWDNGSAFNCGILQKFGLDGLGFINNITTLFLQGFWFKQY